MDENYRAFLLRLQRIHNQMVWRTTLQDVQTGEKTHFANEIEMINHLLQRLAEPASTHIPQTTKHDYKTLNNVQHTSL